MKIGITFSAFDLLHAGHVLMLEEAKKNCDYLIAGLHVNPAAHNSNKNSPVQTVFERYLQLKACKHVDEIIPYESETEVVAMLNSLPIDIRFIGEEYKDKFFTGDYLDIEVYYNRRKHDFSSSNLRKLI